MAKFDSIIKFTGNLDGMVGMKGAKGQTYIRKNVKPTDPKTNAQVQTRNKLSLAGQISKLTPKEAIIGMGGSTRERRNNFMKTILRNAAVDFNGGMSNAVLNPDGLVFSTGRDFPVNVTITPVPKPARGVRVSLSSDEEARLTAAGVKSLMIIFVWSEDDLYRYIDVKTAKTENMSGEQGVSSLNLYSKCNVYVIPLLPVDGAASAAYEEGVSRIENEGYSVIAELSSKGTIALGQSNFSGTGEVTGN